MGIKNYVTKKMMEHKMKDAPPEQQQQIQKLLENHPELFEKISKEIKQEMKNGTDQMAASMKVMRKYQSELQKALQ